MFGKNPEKIVSTRTKMLAGFSAMLAAAALGGCTAHNEQADFKKPKVEPGCNPVSVQLLGQGASYFSIPYTKGNEGGVTDYFEFRDDAHNQSLLVFHEVISPNGETLQVDTARDINTTKPEGDISEKYRTGGYIELHYIRSGDKIGLVGKACTGITSSQHVIFGQQTDKIT